jgi:transcriptional antiterminator RfaH
LHELSEGQAPTLTPGAAVEVLEGPFAGLKGVFQEASGEARALILLRILGQPAVVKLDQSALQAL